MIVKVINEPRLVKSAEHWALGMVIRGPTGEKIFYVQRALLNELIGNPTLMQALINHENVEQDLIDRGLTAEEAHSAIIEGGSRLVRQRSLADSLEQESYPPLSFERSPERAVWGLRKVPQR
jgi:hypothetical protein